ncbi:MAG: hypothetical protein HKN26_01180 [Acidimicrobiales bacterium]|nr:hypothetical protein [Acidimicrobiales bacterium]
MLCDQLAYEIVEYSWGDAELGPFTERHLSHCLRCRRLSGHHLELRAALAELQDRWLAGDVDDIEGWSDDWRRLLDRDRRAALFEEALSSCRRNLARRRSGRANRRRRALPEVWHDLVGAVGSE